MRRILTGFVSSSIVLLGSMYAQSSIEQKTIVSLKKMFGDSVSISSSVQYLSSGQNDSLAWESRSRWSSDTIHFSICRLNGRVVGYGFVDEVKGKTQFITYLAGIRPTGGVQDIDVLAYRESYGGEIGYESFRKQFRDKTVSDKLQPGRDIKNISGATISVRALTAGVKKILSTFEILKPRVQQ
jgi:hypothetical protein